MTVAELIEYLKGFDQNLKVVRINNDIDYGSDFRTIKLAKVKKLMTHDSGDDLDEYDKDLLAHWQEMTQSHRWGRKDCRIETCLVLMENDWE
ncbi:MAG: hypothetical protein HY865_01020 [Chloroflexi bacterium]|nr:hypothetical protein [Chloroflexota bacterium]